MCKKGLLYGSTAKGHLMQLVLLHRCNCFSSFHKGKPCKPSKPSEPSKPQSKWVMQASLELLTKYVQLMLTFATMPRAVLCVLNATRVLRYTGSC